MSADGVEEQPAEQESEQPLEERVQELEQLAEDAFGIAREARQEVARVRDQYEEKLAARDERIAELEAELEHLRDEVDTVSDQTEVLQLGRKASALKPDERAAVVLQTLYNEARKRGDRNNDEPASAAMDAGEAVKTLGGSIHRTQVYGDHGVFQRAVDLVDDEDVCWVKKESRASSKNTRLIVDLEAGDLPTTAAGRSITGEPA